MTIEFWASRKKCPIAIKVEANLISAQMHGNVHMVKTMSIADELVQFGHSRNQIDKLTTKKKRKLLFMSINGHKCQYCTKPLKLEEATWDHVIPLSKNGPNQLSNMLVVCEKCNNEKADKELSEFMLTELFIKRRFLWTTISG